MDRLEAARRLQATDTGLYYVRYFDDFPATAMSDVWDDTVIAGFTSQKAYVVETSTKVIQRCLLMTTDPGDLVLDPTCGSGTTAYVAEQWGRRWITIDASRVPLALARQRLLTATFPYYELRSPQRGPAGGFTYKRRQNAKGEEVGGIVRHVTLRSIATDEPPAEEVLVDRPEVNGKVTRVSGSLLRRGDDPDLRGQRMVTPTLRMRRSPTGCWRCCVRTPSSSSAATGRSPSASCGLRPGRLPCRPRRCSNPAGSSSRSSSAPRTVRSASASSTRPRVRAMPAATSS